ncbi:MAG: winged helix-turn-helix domain-containing protein [Bacteroidia bacterium]|nr:winged helix-turn-helix domain-containing protein [Bacteroidia bacterium]
MDKKAIGTNAGIIWNILNNNEKWDISQLMKKSGLTEAEVYTAVGWLARENKIEIEQRPDNKHYYYLIVEYYF